DEGGDLSRWVYLHPAEVFPASAVRRTGPVLELAETPRPELGELPVLTADGAPSTLRERLAAEPIDGFLILHRGAILYETYPRMERQDRHLVFSVTKAFLGTLVALLEARGELDLSSGVERYLPELAGTGWEGIALRDIADMASGIEGAEEGCGTAPYLDPAHRHFQLEASLGWQPRSAELPAAARSGDTEAFLAALRRVRPPGERRSYTSANTAMLGWLLERVTGRRLAEVLATEIWRRIGAEGEALLLENERGVPIAHGGLAMTLRDLARFGWFLARQERSLFGSGRPALLGPGTPPWVAHASYQWDWIGHAGELVKAGFAGQLLYVDRRRQVVIAHFGTNPTLGSPPALLPVREIAATF
ncbi:MAG TPA: serine hydrolase domain-containing protein, partial [Thermoanaerobaculia bacterium]|nr:serine hydrolase domain-containing protein [Thermoanaerobaculia bacterium]